MTKKFNKKLNLNKTTVSDLNTQAMQGINGGRPQSIEWTDCTECPLETRPCNTTMLECGPECYAVTETQLPFFICCPIE